MLETYTVDHSLVGVRSYCSPVTCRIMPGGSGSNGIISPPRCSDRHDRRRKLGAIVLAYYSLVHTRSAARGLGTKRTLLCTLTQSQNVRS